MKTGDSPSGGSRPWAEVGRGWGLFCLPFRLFFFFLPNIKGARTPSRDPPLPPHNGKVFSFLLCFQWRLETVLDNLVSKKTKGKKIGRSKIVQWTNESVLTLKNSCKLFSSRVILLKVEDLQCISWNRGHPETDPTTERKKLSFSFKTSSSEKEKGN